MIKRIDIADTSDLNAQELAFVEALTTLDENGRHRTVTQAAREAGYNPTYGRAIRHKPKIARAVDERCAQLEAENKEGTQLLLRKLLSAAVGGDKGAAAIFLRAIGRGGNNTQISVTTITPYQERLGDALVRRGLALEESTDEA